MLQSHQRQTLFLCFEFLFSFWRILLLWQEFPGGPVVRTRRFHCWGLGSTPGWGTKIPQAVQRGQQINKKIKNFAPLVVLFLFCISLSLLDILASLLENALLFPIIFKKCASLITSLSPTTAVQFVLALRENFPNKQFTFTSLPFSQCIPTWLPSSCATETTC